MSEIPPHVDKPKIIGLVRSNIKPVAEAFKKPDKPVKTDGYLTVRSWIDRRIILLCEIGHNPSESFEPRCFNSLEKGDRLYENPKHLSSYQTRDIGDRVKNKRYGGAVRAGDFILSFSGLPEHADEALMIIVAIKMDWMGKENALDILNISGNEIGKKLVLDLYK